MEPNLKNAKFLEIPDITIENIGNKTYKNLFFVIDEQNSSKDIQILTTNMIEFKNAHPITLSEDFSPKKKETHQITVKINYPKKNYTYNLYLYVRENVNGRNLSNQLKIIIELKDQEKEQGDQKKKLEENAKKLYSQFVQLSNLSIICNNQEEAIKKFIELKNDKNLIDNWIKEELDKKDEELFNMCFSFFFHI